MLLLWPFYLMKKKIFAVAFWILGQGQKSSDWLALLLPLPEYGTNDCLHNPDLKIKSMLLGLTS